MKDKLPNPIEIANFFIKKGIDTQSPANHRKIQLLTYLTYGWYLGSENKLLMDGVFKAGKYLPYNDEIYQALKGYKKIIYMN